MTNLSPTGASNWTITTSTLSTSVGVAVGMSVGDSLAIGGVFGDGWNLHVLHLDKSLFSGVAARASSLGCLLVGGKIEGDEEEEIRA